jgi:site-specific DNA-methyltransferase (adenine-specific)
MRQIVRGALPLGKGIILDPFMGAGSTVAAANAVGYQSIGVELDPAYFRIAEKAIPVLAELKLKGASSPHRSVGGKSAATKRPIANPHRKSG